MEPSLAESIYIRFSIKFLHFVPFRQQIWPPRAILVSDWLMLKKSSPLKLLGQMEPNLAESIYIRFSIKFLHFVPFCQKIDVKFKLQTCSACQDLPTLQFLSKSEYPFWSNCSFLVKFSKC